MLTLPIKHTMIMITENVHSNAHQILQDINHLVHQLVHVYNFVKLDIMHWIQLVNVLPHVQITTSSTILSPMWNINVWLIVQITHLLMQLMTIV